MAQNGNQNRRHYSPEQKVSILREHLENQVPLSDLAEKYGIHVDGLYNSKNKSFEGAAEREAEKENRLISEVVEENISLKTNLSRS